MNNDKSILQNMLNSSGGKIDQKALEQAAKQKDASALVKNLSNADKQKLESILSDKQALEKVLESPQAKMLFKMFGAPNSTEATQKSKTDRVGKNG